MIQKIWSKNKLDFRNTDVAEKLLSETEVAELWYLVEAEEGYWGDLSKGKFKPKMKILASSLGDKLYPYFDLTGDMVAFSREYDITQNGKKESHFDIYTADKTIKYTTIEGNTVSEIKPNLVKKIPVVYYKQELPDWYNVQPMIDRLETSFSNKADNNDYSGSPIAVVKGEIMGFASKGDQGKFLKISGDGEIKYLESTGAPESVKMEWDALREFILSMTQTPDISFSQMKNLGQLSGVALKLMFLDAHMKARRNEKTFGECIQRRLNLLMAIIGNVIDTSLGGVANNLNINPVFTPYLPINEKEEIENLSTAVTSGIISKETAVENNPLVSDPESEKERIKSDQTEAISGSNI
jgi:SPP1 family phage portal protein